MMKGFFSRARSFLPRFRAGKKTMAAVIMLGLLTGYNTTTSYYAQCSAQVPPFPAAGVQTVGGLFCVWTCCAPVPCPPAPCEVSGTASNVTNTIYNTFNSNLQALAQGLEIFIGQSVDGLVGGILEKINQLELKIIAWWDTLWWYNLRPSLQALTEQITASLYSQSMQIQAAMDAELENFTNMQYEKNEANAQKEYGAELGCPNSSSGGMGRADSISNALRNNWQNNASSSGANRAGTPGATGAGAFQKARSDRFETIFCDPNDNGGDNLCAATDPQFFNADVKTTKFLYDNLTLPIDSSADGMKYAAAVEELIQNLSGSAAMDPIPVGALGGPAGQEKWLLRRSFLARNAAARSVPQLLAGWRTPGSQVGPWIRELREQAGIPLTEISDNPSYKEVLKAMSIDRYNSGTFANELIAEQGEIEQMKLAVSSFYLMQLRDYHDLLERTALNLAVQVSIMADGLQRPPPLAAMPLR